MAQLSASSPANYDSSPSSPSGRKPLSLNSGLTFNGNFIISSGGEQSLPIPVSEPSIVLIDWHTEDGGEVEFSANFRAHNDDVDRNLLLPESKRRSENRLEVETAGVCTIRFKNVAVGYLGSSKRTKVIYTAQLQVKPDAIAEAHGRSSEVAARVGKLRATAAQLQTQAAEALTNASLKRVEVQSLRKQALQLENAAGAEAARGVRLTRESWDLNRQVEGLVEEAEAAKDLPVTLQISIFEARGLQHLGFGGKLPRCRCMIKPKIETEQAFMRETRASENASDPVWNETVVVSWTSGAILEFCVFDAASPTSYGLATVLTSDRFLPGGFEGELSLCGVEKAVLGVRVAPVEVPGLGLSAVLDAAELAGTWADYQVLWIGTDVSLFQGKVPTLQGYNSIESAAKGLMSGDKDIAAAIFQQGFCLVFDTEPCMHALLYRSDIVGSLLSLLVDINFFPKNDSAVSKESVVQRPRSEDS